MQPKVFELELKRAIAKTTDKLMMADWRDDLVYATWLAQTYHFVSHTGRLICTAAGRFSLEDENLHKMMTAHFREEADHDLMAKKDVQALGFEMRDLAEWPLTRVFVEHLRYEIEHVSPFCIFGRIYFLEGLACEAGPEILARLQPKTLELGGSFLKLHAEEDQHHHAESLKLLGGMKPEAIEAVHRGFISSRSIYDAMADQVVATSVAGAQTQTQTKKVA